MQSFSVMGSVDVVGKDPAFWFRNLPMVVSVLVTPLGLSSFSRGILPSPPKNEHELSCQLSGSQEGKSYSWKRDRSLIIQYCILLLKLLISGFALNPHLQL